MNNGIVPPKILISGIPGSGKSTYCRWLEQEKGFIHLDFDELLNGRGSERKLMLIQHLSNTAVDFIRAIAEEKRPIVIDWGFPVAGLSLIRLFKLSGITIWWFDGDRAAAEESFIRRGTVPLEAFRAQMRSIAQGWSQIEEVIGDNVIYAVNAGPSYATPEIIYQRMFSS